MNGCKSVSWRSCCPRNSVAAPAKRKKAAKRTATGNGAASSAPEQVSASLYLQFGELLGQDPEQTMQRIGSGVRLCHLSLREWFCVAAHSERTS
jgi:hypothetical protein